MPTRPIWLVGCGTMAGAMLQGWLLADLPPSRFHVIDPGRPDLPDGVEHHSAPPENGFGDAIIQLGFKPHMLADIAPGLSGAVGQQSTLTSILAGVQLATLAEAFPNAGEIVRIMPNTPVALGKGAVGMIADHTSGAGATDIAKLLGLLGTAEWIADEDSFNAVTALSGSGPAFLFRFIDALAKGGEAIGLPADQAMRLAMATVEGAAGLATASGDDPAVLANKVASPGGSTREGLNVLDEADALDRLVHATLAASKRRNEEMAEEARRT